MIARAGRASAGANSLLLEKLMAASSARPKLRKIVERVRDELRAELVLATVARIHSRQPAPEEIEEMMAALDLAERALGGEQERKAG
jgi:hypothetical protein